MLVLSRKPGESIKIGDDIILRIADVRGENVRIAIDAPRQIKIYRGEVYDSILEANKLAASFELPIDSLLKKNI